MSINYDMMKKLHPKQKAALTRAIKSGDRTKLIELCRKTVREWEEIGAWPDDWSRWQRALDDNVSSNYLSRDYVSLDDLDNL